MTGQMYDMKTGVDFESQAKAAELTKQGVAAGLSFEAWINPYDYLQALTVTDIKSGDAVAILHGEKRFDFAKKLLL